MGAARVLVVDDEPQILRFLRPSLGAAGYDVMVASTGAEALRLSATQSPSVIVLDLGLPDMDGKEVLRQLRQWSKTPVVVLSARDREAEKIAALDLGADDYVNKPFGIGELMARLRTAVRHAAQQAGERLKFSAGKLVVDIATREVAIDGDPVKLTPKEFDLLALLVRNAGRVVTHRQLLTSVWGPAHADDLHYLRVFVGQLRQKLEPVPSAPRVIVTEPGIGYRLEPDED